MPKPWDNFKPDIVRLYIKQGLTLKEVRKIMCEKGLVASTRAYQMKFDEWGLHKYGQNRDSGDQKRPARTKPLVEPQTPKESSPSPGVSQDLSVAMAGHLADLSQCLVNLSSLISDQPAKLATEEILTLLLVKWNPDGQYLNYALLVLKNKYGAIEIAQPCGTGTIFKLIEERVGAEECFPLTKACLEADLTPPISENCSAAMWKNCWRAASNLKTWNGAKSLLYEGCNKRKLLGRTFLYASMVVVAERLLQGYMTELEQLRAKAEPLTDSELDKAARLRKQYMDILTDFRQTDFIPSVKWYRYSLTITEWNEAVAAENIDKQNNLENNEFKLEYQQLKDFCSSLDGGVDHVIENLVLTASILKKTKSIVQPRLELGLHDPNNLHLSFVGRMGLDQIASDRTPVLDNSNDVVNSMLRNFRTGMLRQEDITNALQEDGEEFSIFEISRKGRDNLFDVIHKLVPLNEVQAFMKVLLVSLGNEFHRSTTFEWWKLVFFCSRWKNLEALVTPAEVSLHLGTKMSTDAVKFLIDNTILLAGERLMAVLKKELDREEENISEFGYGLMRYNELQREYMAILKTFQERKLQTNQAWFEYLLETFGRRNLLPRAG